MKRVSLSRYNVTGKGTRVGRPGYRWILECTTLDSMSTKQSAKYNSAPTGKECTGWVDINSPQICSSGSHYNLKETDVLTLRLSLLHKLV